MRLIDADKLILRVLDASFFDNSDEDVVWKMVQDAPTIDPIRTAGGCRCGECKHCENIHNNKALMCNLSAAGVQIGLTFVTPDDFCSYGEPREDPHD